MRFAEPEVHLLLWMIPVLVLLFVLAARRRRRAQAALGDPVLFARVTVASPRGWLVLRRTLLLVSVLLLTLAAARPQRALDWINVEQTGIDLVVALDVSESMSAADIKPSRFARARQDVKDLLSRLEGDRVALVVFSGEAAVQCPLTVDYGAVRLLLDVAEPGMLTRPGTDLEVALDRALACFETEDASQARAVLLITDGESHEGNIARAVARMKTANVRAFVIGVGRPEGEPIPVTDPDGKVSYKSSREGQVVMTRLDEATLQEIALETGGAYVPAIHGIEGVDRVAGLIAEMEEKAFEAGFFKLYEERYVEFLVPALLFLAAELLIGDRGRRRKERA